MMKKWKYALMAAATALVIPAFASRAEMPPIGMPNPLVEYKTYHALAEATDSRPLFLPKGTLLAGKCHLTDYIAIGGKLSDIRYRMDDGSTLSSARQGWWEKRQEKISADSIPVAGNRA